MDKLFGDFKKFFKPPKCVIDNLIFRLHYKYSLIILVAFSIAVTGSQFIGNPIDCISKDDIPENLLKTFCWISTTFSIRSAWQKEIGKAVPYPGIDKYIEGEDRVYHAYYQWVCFVLFLQGLVFYIPRYMWRNVEGHKILNLRMKFNNPVVRAKENLDETNLLVNYLTENIGSHSHSFYGSFYMFCEILNFVNVVVQIYVMDTFLGGEFTTYGIEVLAFTEWDYALRYDPMIKVFPRMTKCTFYRFGSSGDVQKHDAMCLIPINILNEKIYIFLWFWFLILAILSGLIILYRIAIIVFKPFRYYVLSWKCNWTKRTDWPEWPEKTKKTETTEENDLEIVNSRCDKDDWFVLSLICKNMSTENFKFVISELKIQILKKEKEKAEKEAKEKAEKEAAKEAKEKADRMKQLGEKPSKGEKSF